mmetsp:Transcript_75352/g.218837  ORF Transcript_75352/g.218837 Transcript_75352/m.218837 type:complete len:294 (-) Transcript_75352:819-1700(-)
MYHDAVEVFHVLGEAQKQQVHCGITGRVEAVADLGVKKVGAQQLENVVNHDLRPTTLQQHLGAPCVTQLRIPVEAAKRQRSRGQRGQPSEELPHQHLPLWRARASDRVGLAALCEKRRIVHQLPCAAMRHGLWAQLRIALFQSVRRRIPHLRRSRELQSPPPVGALRGLRLPHDLPILVVPRLRSVLASLIPRLEHPRHSTGHRDHPDALARHEGRLPMALPDGILPGTLRLELLRAVRGPKDPHEQLDRALEARIVHKRCERGSVEEHVLACLLPIADSAAGRLPALLLGLL